jgi:tetratricopeptide (TPR) repeat protein
VKSRNSVFRYKGKDVDVQKAGGELGVAGLVSGRVTPHGDTVEVSAELTDVRDNNELWGQHYSGKSTEIIALQQQIAGDLAARLRSGMTTSEKQQVTKQGTENPQAYELYTKGRYAFSKRTADEINAALSYFNQAIAKDPNYAVAYGGLADAYSVAAAYGANPAEVYPKSNAAARKALELDPTLARPHAVLGANMMEYEWDFPGGEAEYKKGFQLDPNDAQAHMWYAEDLVWIGRQEEAFTEINRAMQLDPQSLIISYDIAEIDLWARKYDDAVATCRKFIKENPTFARPHDTLREAYWLKGMYPEMLSEAKTYGELSGDPLERAVAFAMEEGFRSGGWKAALKRGIETRVAARKKGYSSPYLIAVLYADMGDKDATFQWLTTAYRERDTNLQRLKVDPWLDSVRSDPRFAELGKKIGLS